MFAESDSEDGRCQLVNAGTLSPLFFVLVEVTFALCALSGLLIGVGMFLVRRFVPALTSALMMVIGVGIASSFGVTAISIALSAGRGGDGSMIAMTFFAFLVISLLAAVVVAGLLTLVQSGRVVVKPRVAFFSSFIDFALLLCLMFAIRQLFYNAEIRRVTSESMDREQVRRASLERLTKEIPNGMTEMPLEAIDAQRHQEQAMKKLGMPSRPFIEPEVEAKIREYHRLREHIEFTPQPVFQQLNKDHRQRQIFAISGWAVGALAVPFAFRRNRRPPADAEPPGEV